MGRGDPLRSDAELREARAAQRSRLPGALLILDPPEAPLWPARAEPPAALDLLGIGQNSLDHVIAIEAASPSAGASPSGKGRDLPGGQVATAMLACARLGLRTAYAGAVGDDAAGAAALAPLRRAGVDLSGVKHVAGGRTRRALIRVDRASGDRIVTPKRDPRVALAPGDLDRTRIASARALLIDAEDPAASLWAAEVANAAGVPVILDVDRPGPQVDALLGRADFPIVPRAFAEFLGGGHPLREALRELAERARCLAVVTLGEGGAIARAHDSGREFESPAFRVAAQDTTGAGDAFHAAFAWALIEGASAGAALRAASAAAAMNCRSSGAQGGLPDRAELEAFLSAHPVP